jgi:hypothetical protein
MGAVEVRLVLHLLSALRSTRRLRTLPERLLDQSLAVVRRACSVQSDAEVVAMVGKSEAIVSLKELDLQKWLDGRACSTCFSNTGCTLQKWEPARPEPLHLWCNHWSGDPEEKDCGSMATRWYLVEYGEGDVIVSRCGHHAHARYFWGDHNARELTRDEMEAAEVHMA